MLRRHRAGAANMGKVMETYAVVETGGKQYRVQQDSTLDIEFQQGEVGSELTLDRVLAVSNGEALTVGKPVVDGAAVTVEIVDQFRGKKVVAYKKKRRKGYERKIGHRQELTRVKVKGIQS